MYIEWGQEVLNYKKIFFELSNLPIIFKNQNIQQDKEN